MSYVCGLDNGCRSGSCTVCAPQRGCDEARLRFDGEFDLCPKCVSSGVLCPGQAHPLIKRCVKDGKYIEITKDLMEAPELSLG